MSRGYFDSDRNPFLDRNQLKNLKTITIHSSGWAPTLQRIDGVLFDLTIRVVSNICICKLAKSLLTHKKKAEVEIGLVLTQKAGSICGSYETFRLNEVG